MYNSIGTNGQFQPPIYVEGDNNTKLGQDRYEVYVNGDYVGNKVLLTQTDSPKDVSTFLKSRGFEDFTMATEGDHCKVDVEDAEVADNIKNHLRVYCDIR